MSTPSRSASSVALPCGRTLKPTMTASDAAARLTLVSVMRTDTAVDDPQADLVADVDLGQRVLQGLDRTGAVALEDEPQLLRLALLQLLEQLVEGLAPGAGRLGRHPQPGRTPFGDLPGHPVVVDDDEAVAGAGHRGQAEHLDRERRRSLVDVVAVVVEQGPDPAVRRTGHDRVADVQRAALDQDGGDRAATLVQVGLDGHTLTVHVRVGPQVERRVGGQDDRLEQLVQADPGDRGDVDEHRVAAVLLRHQAVLGELAAHLGRVGALACRSC